MQPSRDRVSNLGTSIHLWFLQRHGRSSPTLVMVGSCKSCGSSDLAVNTNCAVEAVSLPGWPHILRLFHLISDESFCDILSVTDSVRST